MLTTSVWSPIFCLCIKAFWLTRKDNERRPVHHAVLMGDCTLSHWHVSKGEAQHLFWNFANYQSDCNFTNVPLHSNTNKIRKGSCTKPTRCITKQLTLQIFQRKKLVCHNESFCLCCCTSQSCDPKIQQMQEKKIKALPHSSLAAFYLQIGGSARVVPLSKQHYVVPHKGTEADFYRKLLCQLATCQTTLHMMSLLFHFWCWRSLFCCEKWPTKQRNIFPSKLVSSHYLSCSIVFSTVCSCHFPLICFIKYGQKHDLHFA